jgi:cold-inducible RNA-binding protein
MNLYVGNVPKGTKNRELQRLFEEHGKVVSAAIARDKKSGTSRGFAFIEMANRNEGEHAIAALNESDFKGEKLHVNEARERQNKDKGSGRQRGADREDHASHESMRGGWNHGARGAHTNRGQGGKRGM